MADPLTLATSILTVAGAAYSSVEGLYNLIDGLASAPKAIADIKTDLSSVQRVLNSLRDTLDRGGSTALGPALEYAGIVAALEVCSKVCDNFKGMIAKYTVSSTETSFGMKARLTVTFRKSKLEAFRARLNGSRDTIEFALTSAILCACYCSTNNLHRPSSNCMLRDSTMTMASYTSGEELKARLLDREEKFKSQLQRLVALEQDMEDLEVAEDDPDNDVIPITKSDRDLTLAIIPVLRQVCEKALPTNDQVNNIKQKFGGATAEGGSNIFEGTLGSDHGLFKAVQEFGDGIAKGQSMIVRGVVGNEALRTLSSPPQPKLDVGK